MGTNTTKLGLLKPSENDFYNQQTEQADNWEKVDKFAENIQNDVDATWGGTYGGYIQDVSAKVVGQRYIDKINGKAYECIKTGSNINSVEFFKECNVKNNLHNFAKIDAEGDGAKFSNYGFKLYKKESGAKNYIDCSSDFSEVVFASFTAWNPISTATGLQHIVSFQEIVDKTTVIYNSHTKLTNGTTFVNAYAGKSENSVCAVHCLVYGILKK